MSTSIFTSFDYWDFFWFFLLTKRKTPKKARSFAAEKSLNFDNLTESWCNLFYQCLSLLFNHLFDFFSVLMAKELLQLPRTNQSRFGLFLSTNLSTLSWVTKAGSVVPNLLQKKKLLQQVYCSPFVFTMKLIPNI